MLESHRSSRFRTCACPNAHGIAVMGAFVLLVSAGGGCSMLGLGSEDSPQAASQATKAPTASANPRAGAAKEPAAKSTPKIAAKPSSKDDLTLQSTDMQSMLAALDRLNSGAAAAPGPSAARGTPGADQPAPVAAEAAPPSTMPVTGQPAPAPMLVATTTAVGEAPALKPEPAPAPAPTPTPVDPAPIPAVQAQTATPPAPAAPAPDTAPPQSATAPSASAAPTANPMERLDIPRLALCQRVESFGKFTPLQSSTFLAGRPAAMILYTELAGFAQDADESSGERLHVAELGQTVELFLDSDGTRQYAVPMQRIREVTRSPRRDFYLVQRVELPRTLSVGRYNLKVRVTDLISRQEVERTQRIEIVADPSAKADSSTRTKPKAGASPSVATGEGAR